MSDVKVGHDARCNLENGVVSLRSEHDVERTVERISAILAERGVKLFATIDHAAEASIALDLPLKVLVSEDPDGVTWISYLAPVCLAERHELPRELAGALNAVAAVAESAAGS